MTLNYFLTAITLHKAVTLCNITLHKAVTLCNIREIRECLKLDQDHKECHTHYKKVKKLAKQMNSAQEKINEGKCFVY